MARISGTVSRAVPLDPVIGRPFTLSGTFDLFVSASELASIASMLDALAASGILTAHQRFFESDSLIANATAPIVDVAASGTAQPAPMQIIPHAIPDVAGDNAYTYTAAKKIEVVDVVIHKGAVGAGNTIQLQDAAAAAISDAIVAAVANAVTHAGTLDPVKKVIAAGAQYKLAAHRAGGSMAAEVYLLVVLR